MTTVFNDYGFGTNELFTTWFHEKQILNFYKFFDIQHYFTNKNKQNKATQHKFRENFKFVNIEKLIN